MPSLFDFSPEKATSSKMHISIGSLPSYIDPAQPPTKQSPWRQIGQVPFVHTVSVVMPDEMYELIWQKLEEKFKKVRYAKVIMKLADLLDGDFFTEYIKKGNVIMLSEGRPGVDNVFSLRDGLLQLNLDKESYERAGLQGKPTPSGGRKHTKSRYLVEIELRQPSMLHGKKGFERLVWAAKNVLNQSMTWLFADVNDGRRALASSSPLSKHHATCLEVDPNMQVVEDAVVPSTMSSVTGLDAVIPKSEDQEDYYELIEWLDLVTLNSPSIAAGNDFDPYITRYVVPDSKGPGQRLRILRFGGLINPIWVRQVLINVIRQSRNSGTRHWLAFTVVAHRIDAVGNIGGYTIILTPSPQSDQIEADDGDVSLRSTEDSQTPKSASGGLQRFAVFQMVVG